MRQQRHRGLAWGLAAMGMGLALPCGAVDIWAGRGLEEARRTRVTLEGGLILDMDGYVQETTRALYDVTGSIYKQEDAEDYSLDDFAVDGGYLLLGVGFEHAWEYLTFQSRVLGMNPQTESVAQRNYYLEVDDVSFGGTTYDNIKIPKGTPFSAEMMAALMEFDLLVTPLYFEFDEITRFTPWVGLGAVVLVGTYEIDAGPATGTTPYQYPPEEFVVGGHAEGWLAGGLPELVLGGEFAVGEEGWRRFAIQGQVGFFSYNGSSGYFSSSDEGYDKQADIDHLRYKLRALYDVPLTSGHVLTFGAQYEVIDSEATLEQDASSPEEILARQERFDKIVEFSMSTLTAFVGIAF